MARVHSRYKFLDPAALLRLGKINLVAKGVVEGFVTGLHKSPYHGFSVEFAEHREYSPGDPLKMIDWRAFGRTDRFYVKLFEDETNVRCYLLLDISKSMSYQGGAAMRKIDYACFLAASLAYLMIRQQDSVALVTFDEKVRKFLSPSSTPSRLRYMLQTLEEIRAEQRTNIGETFHELAERFHKRSLIIIISDLYDEEREIVRALRHFRHRKHEVLLFHLLAPQEREFPYTRLVDFLDLETNERLQVDPRHVRDEYLRQLEAFMATFRRACAEQGAEYVPVDTSTPFELMLAAYLSRRLRFTA